MIFGIIHIDDAEPEDVVLLEKSIALDPSGGDVAKVLKDCMTGDATLWRGRNGKGRLIVVTQILDEPRGRELLTWHLAGEHLNMFTDAPVVHNTLERYAYRLGCVRMSALVTPEMVSTMQMVGYIPRWIRMERELPNG